MSWIKERFSTSKDKQLDRVSKNDSNRSGPFVSVETESKARNGNFSVDDRKKVTKKM